MNLNLSKKNDKKSNKPLFGEKPTRIDWATTTYPWA